MFGTGWFGRSSGDREHLVDAALTLGWRIEVGQARFPSPVIRDESEHKCDRVAPSLFRLDWLTDHPRRTTDYGVARCVSGAMTAEQRHRES